MAKKSDNEHDHDHESKHEHGGSSVGFYIFIALVLGVITYVEFALVEYQDTWFPMLSGTWIFVLLAVLSVVKFLLVVMFFMHLKGDHIAFTGFFTSGMVIAVGTLFALSALFTVRSVARAQTPQQEGAAEAHGEAEAGAHGEGEAAEVNPEQPLVHSLEYPAPKNQDTSLFDYNTLDHRGGLNEPQTEGQTTPDGLPRAPAAGEIALVDPFSAEGAALAPSAAGGAAGAASGSGDPAAGEALFTGALGCTSCHGADGTGGVGPNLTDSEWIYGGDEAAIVETLTNGRPGGMPAFSGQASEEDIVNVAAYVMSLGGATGGGAEEGAPASEGGAPAGGNAAAEGGDAGAGSEAQAAPPEAEAAAEGGAAGDPAAGQTLFTGTLGCAGCHGQDGGGGMGPALNDGEWLYGGDAAAITETLTNGRPGGMPAFGGQASEADIANVVAFVMSLSGQ